MFEDLVKSNNHSENKAEQLTSIEVVDKFTLPYDILGMLDPFFSNGYILDYIYGMRNPDKEYLEGHYVLINPLLAVEVDLVIRVKETK